MIIREIIWLRQFADKIERRHHVSQAEVDETLAKQPPVRRMRRGARSLSCSWTNRCRTLLVDLFHLQRARTSTGYFCSGIRLEGVKRLCQTQEVRRPKLAILC